MGAHNCDIDDDAALNGVFGREQQRDAEEAREKYGYNNYGQGNPQAPIAKRAPIQKLNKVRVHLELTDDELNKLKKIGLSRVTKAIKDLIENQ